MWERRTDDLDFGHVRVGIGTPCLSTLLVTPDLGPEEDLDPVTSMELRRLIRHRAVVPDAPIAIELTSLAAITVSGDTLRARGLLRAVLCQLAVLHSPQDLRIAAAVNPLTAAEWDWLKWLPHHQHPHILDDGGPARMTYSTVSSAEAALANSEGARAVLLVDGSLITDESLVKSPGFAGVTVLELGTSCHAIAGLSVAVSGEHLTVRDGAGDEIVARADSMTTAQAVACARRITPFQPATAPTGGVVHSTAPAVWPALMGIADVGEIDADAVWHTTRAPERELRVPIGISEHGHLIELDIKEAAANGMGPHGLCIGATGSGKSE